MWVVCHIKGSSLLKPPIYPPQKKKKTSVDENQQNLKNRGEGSSLLLTPRGVWRKVIKAPSNRGKGSSCLNPNFWCCFATKTSTDRGKESSLLKVSRIPHLWPKLDQNRTKGSSLLLDRFARALTETFWNSPKPNPGEQSVPKVERSSRLHRL